MKRIADCEDYSCRIWISPRFFKVDIKVRCLLSNENVVKITSWMTASEKDIPHFGLHSLVRQSDKSTLIVTGYGRMNVRFPEGGLGQEMQIVTQLCPE